MENYISLGFNIAILVFVFFGVFWGFVRGLRKTACRGIFLIITTILLLLLTPIITKALLNIKINVNFDAGDSTLSGTHSIKNIITFFIEGFIGKDFVTKYPEFTEFLISLPLLLVNVVLYVVLFWLCKYLLYPINYLFYKIAFAPRKKKESLGFSKNPFDIYNDDEEKSQQLNEEDLKEIAKALNEKDGLNLNNTPKENLDTNETITPSEVIESNENNVEEVNLISNTTFISTEEKQTEQITQDSNNEEIQPIPSEKGMFIVKDPEYNKHQKLTEELKELTEKQEKKERKNLKKQIKKERKKIRKHRLLGALVGGACGLIVMFNTLIPVYGLLDIAERLNKTKLENLTEEDLSLSNITDGLTDEIMNGYDKSAFNLISKYSGLKGLAIASFDNLTTTKVNDKKFILREDIDSIVTAVEKADKLIGKFKEYAKDGNMSDLTKEELAILLTDTKAFINDAKQIKAVNILSDYLIPIAGNYLLNNEIDFSDNKIVNEMIASLIAQMLEDNNINIFDECTSIVEIAEYLNNQSLLTVILSGDFDNPIDILKNLDANFASDFTNKLYKLKLVDISLPYIFNISFTLLDSAIDFGYEENNATTTQLKASFTEFLNKTINLGKTLDSNSDYYLTTSSLIPLGDFMDVIKSSYLINSETYYNLVSYAQIKLFNIISEILPPELEKSVNGEVLGNLDRVMSWKQEMTLINQAITLLRHKSDGFIGDVVEGQDLREGASINLELSDALFKNLGKTFDVLEKSILFGSPNVRVLNLDGNGNKEYTLSTITYIMCDLLEYVKNDSLSADGFEELNEFILKIENNLLTSEHVYNNEIKFWENEFTCISPLIIELSTIIKGEEFSISSSLGSKLDKAKHSIMLGNNACITLISNTLEIVKDGILDEDYTYNDGSNLANPQTLNDKIYELFDGISTNLGTNSIKTKEKTIANFWATELDKYMSLLDIADDAQNLDDLNNISSLGENLDNIFDSYTIPRLKISSLIAFAIKDAKINNAEINTLDYAINQTIDNISSKLNSETFFDGLNTTNFWTIELGYVDKLMNLEIDENADNLDEIGKSLDDITQGYKEVTLDNPNTTENEFNIKEIRSSLLIEHIDLRRVISSGIKEAKYSNAEEGSVNEAINNLIDNISNKLIDDTFYDNLPANKKIDFWYIELSHIGNLKNIELGENVSDNLINIGVSLDELHQGYEKLVDDDPTTIQIEFSKEIRGSVLIEHKDIGKIFAVAIEDVKIENATPGTTDYAINEMLNSISAKLSSDTFFDNIADKTNFWTIELTHIDTLNTMDFVESQDNTLTNMGITLDTITDGYYSEDDLTTPSDESQNLVRKSLLIEHKDLGKVIASALDDAKLANTTDINKSINSMITNIGNKLKDQTFFDALSDDNKIGFWMFELNYIDYLKNIEFEEIEDNSDTTDVDESYTLKNMGESLDVVTDGYYIQLAPTQYYQVRPSLLITRVDLGTIIASALNEAKLDESSTTNQSINQLMTNVGNKLKDSTFHDNLSNANKLSFWSIELGYIDTLKNINFSDDLVGNLPSIGEKLDETTDGDGTNRGSLLIVHRDLRNIIANAINEYKTSLTSSFSEVKIKAAITKAITSIQTNMADTINIPAISFEYELTKIQTFSNLEITAELFSGTDDDAIKAQNRETLSTIGKSLDSIAFNKNTTTPIKYNNNYSTANPSYENPNSLITTRQIINELFKDIFDTSKIENPTDEKDIAYNKLITAIENTITEHSANDSVLSWQRELGFINMLTQLSMLSELTFDNVATNVGSIVDGIAFKSTSNTFTDIEYNSSHEITTLPGNNFYDESTHTVVGNSLFITRSDLLTAVHDMIVILEQSEDSSESTYSISKADIINELLGNVTDKVAYDNTTLSDTNNYYSTLSTSLTELTSIKSLIESKSSQLNSDFNSTIAEDTDALLDNLQDKIISGAATTRKLAIYALECVYNLLLNQATSSLTGAELEIAKTAFNSSAVGTYMIDLKEYYLDYYEINTTKDPKTKEYYVTTESIDGNKYPNPFATLQSKIGA